MTHATAYKGLVKGFTFGYVQEVEMEPICAPPAVLCGQRAEWMLPTGEVFKGTYVAVHIRHVLPGQEGAPVNPRRWVEWSLWSDDEGFVLVRLNATLVPGEHSFTHKRRIDTAADLKEVLILGAVLPPHVLELLICQMNTNSAEKLDQIWRAA